MSSRLHIGSTLEARYLILAEVGAGGMGSVYKAEDLPLNRQVAIKLLDRLSSTTDSSELIERLHREARAMSMLIHKNIVAIYSLGIFQNNIPFIVMEFVEGRSLRSILQEGGPIPWPRALSLFSQIIDGLQAAHSRGILHRDIKPENILVSNSGGEEIAKVADFGLCQIICNDAQQQLKLTQTGELIGTVNYMAPEIGQTHNITAAADVYGLACLLHEILTASPLFIADSPPAVIVKHRLDKPPTLADKCPGYKWPSELEALLQTCLVKTPEQRPSLQVIKNTLQSAFPQAESRILPPVPAGSLARSLGTSRGFKAGQMALAGICLLALLLGLAFLSSPAWLPTTTGQELYLRFVVPVVPESVSVSEVRKNIPLLLHSSQTAFAEFSRRVLNQPPVRWSHYSLARVYFIIHAEARKHGNTELAQQAALAAFREQVHTLIREQGKEPASSEPLKPEFCATVDYLQEMAAERPTWRLVQDICAQMWSNRRGNMVAYGHVPAVKRKFCCLYEESLRKSVLALGAQEAKLGARLLTKASLAAYEEGDLNKECELLGKAKALQESCDCLGEDDCCTLLARMGHCMLKQNKFSEAEEIISKATRGQSPESESLSSGAMISFIGEYYFEKADYRHVIEFLRPRLAAAIKEAGYGIKSKLQRDDFLHLRFAAAKPEPKILWHSLVTWYRELAISLSRQGQIGASREFARQFEALKLKVPEDGQRLLRDVTILIDAEMKNKSEFLACHPVLAKNEYSLYARNWALAQKCCLSERESNTEWTKEGLLAGSMKERQDFADAVMGNLVVDLVQLKKADGAAANSQAIRQLRRNLQNFLVVCQTGGTEHPVDPRLWQELWTELSRKESAFKADPDYRIARDLLHGALEARCLANVAE